MIKINNLKKSYGKSGKLVVDDVSLEVLPNEIFGFLGPNGAGKSTTIKCLTGIIPFDSGSIQICGHDIKEDAIKAKASIGFVPDNHMVYDKLSGREYAYFMADIYGVSMEDRKARLDKYAKLFDLTDAINNPISSYSHGMKQKISIIGALIHNPKVWVLDEPLTGLDPKSAYELKELMREHARQGNAVFFSSHVLDVVEKLCDRIGIIDNGQLITVCTLEELKERRSDMSLETFFLSMTGDSIAEIDAQIGEKSVLNGENVDKAASDTLASGNIAAESMATATDGNEVKNNPTATDEIVENNVEIKGKENKTNTDEKVEISANDKVTKE